MSVVDRRGLIAGALALGAAPGLARAALPAGGLIRFQVLRNGKPFGHYNVSFAQQGPDLTVVSDGVMSMKIGPVVVVDYHHNCRELWRNGQFMTLQSRTVRDGVAEGVSAQRTDAGVAITTAKGRVVAASTVAPLSHWNPAVLQGVMFNPQTGLLVSARTSNAGRAPVPLASGATTPATRWLIRGDTTIDDAYDDAGVWCYLKGVLPDRSIMEYRRL